MIDESAVVDKKIEGRMKHERKCAAGKVQTLRSKSFLVQTVGTSLVAIKKSLPLLPKVRHVSFRRSPGNENCFRRTGWVLPVNCRRVLYVPSDRRMTVSMLYRLVTCS